MTQPPGRASPGQPPAQPAASATGSSPIGYPVAGLERRFHAFAIDRIASWSLAAGAGAAAWLLVGGWQAVAFSVAGVVVAWWLASSVVLGLTGTSPGKALVGLRVVHHGTGAALGVGPALVRSLLLGLLGLPTFGIGVATLAWTAVEDPGQERRGWHDHLTSSVVVDVSPRPVQDATAADEAPRHIVNLTALRLVPAPPVEQLATPPRSTSPEQSVRSLPPASPSAPPSPTSPKAPADPAPAAPPAPVSRPDDESADDPGRTVVRGSRAPAPRWRVRFDNGETFLVEGLALVGRKPEARAGEPVRHLVPLTSQDMSVSKTHAQFGPTPDGTIAVMDRGSTNGTLLVRQGVSRRLSAGRPATLVGGDTVVFGDRRMTIGLES